MASSVSIGPVVVPGIVLALIVGFIAARIVLGRFKESDSEVVSWVIDRGTTAFIVGFVVWKIWPIFRWWEAILADPIVLLRTPGGATGTIVGILSAGLVVIPGLLRDRKRLIPTLSALLALTVGTAVGIAGINTFVDTQFSPGTAITEELSVTTIAGEELNLLATTDGPTVLTFWATWCGPCRSELPIKKAFYEEYADTVGFIAVNMTRTEPSIDTVERYIADHNIEYPVALDSNGTVAAFFGIRGTPTTIVVDTDGVVIARWTGPSSYDRLVRAVD
jgi:thiol-disulfide isomerase/thioredoxin